MRSLIPSSLRRRTLVLSSLSYSGISSTTFTSSPIFLSSRSTFRLPIVSLSSSSTKANFATFFGISNEGEANAKSAEEFYKKIKSLNEKIIKPLNIRLYGPLDKTLDEFTPLPQVLVLGNHSSGKSTFINYMCGRSIQATGVAPTDDGFTFIAPGKEDIDQDGPSVVGDNALGFTGLRTFGTGLIGHIHLKIRKNLSLNDVMLIDSPASLRSSYGGIINASNPSAISASSYSSSMDSSKDRGYDFEGVVRWLAERADIILLFQDPAKPGTTGETLSILTKALGGMDHKLFILLNKADQFGTVHDFARAYGALCWNLSKVIPRKDLPRIYAMCVPVTNAASTSSSPSTTTASNVLPTTTTSKPAVSGTDTGLPVGTLRDAMGDLEAARAEIMAEVRRAPLRRVDNMVTRLYDSARLLRMYAVVLQAVRKEYLTEASKLWGSVIVGGGTVAALGGGLIFWGALEIGLPLIATAVIGSGGASFYVSKILQKKFDYIVEGTGLDEIFRKVHVLPLAERDEFISQLYERIRPQLQTTLKTFGIRNSPSVKRSDLTALDTIIDIDTPNLRKASTKAGFLSGTTPGMNN